ncbi:MAG: cation-translocating P-type ATPase [Oscillospiraceae bacterium]|jgi:Ca2+-transporting ATPase|nr:cation-translocating P-type ATPase [Oscillospiraceae bacterium]
MKHYLETVDAVFAEVGSTAAGLTQAQAEAHLVANGKNKLDQAEKDSMIKRFFGQMKDPMIIILLVAAAISAGMAVVEGAFPTDVIIILTVVIINAVLGVYQESKAEKAIEALQEMSAATSKVLRDGEQASVKSEDLVTGDVIILEAGDAIPADCRIFQSASLKIEEAALTGESFPITKMIDFIEGKDRDAEVPLGDRKNMAYMGSTVAFGRGKAVVVGTGMATEMGKIANAIANAEEGETPLQKKLSQLSKILTWAVVGICVFIFAFDIIYALTNHLSGVGSNWIDFIKSADGAAWQTLFQSIEGHAWLDFFMTAVSLAVAAIPEGLVAVVTIVLSMGVTNMSRKNAIIRKLTAVETLGCAQIICSDKTGTLTQNKMTVTEHYGEDETLLATCMVLCNDAKLGADGKVLGEPTEAALVHYGVKLELSQAALAQTLPRVTEAPFDSGRKMMSTVHGLLLPQDDPDAPPQYAGFVQYTKGGPDVVLGRCTHVLKNGQRVPLTDADRADILAANKALADRALRVLAAAKRDWDAVPTSSEPADLEQELTFIGLTGMIDPVRPEVKSAIEECAGAGIRPVMITGDHKDTAVAIAKELGILEDASHAITGAELDAISEEEFAQRVVEFSVYARVQPEHKTRIVNAWRAKGYITAMTGDGVNDAPSIKSADIGVGMGITGTDVTKNVADMVLADDNFATIVSAVGEGRRIYDNIRKAIQFLLSSNLSEVLGIFTASILQFTLLKPAHLLWINLVTDCFPALALGAEHAEHDIMLRRPRKSTDGVFSGGLGVDSLYQGIVVTFLTLAAFFIGEFMETGHWKFFDISLADGAQGMTMAFFTMSMCEIFHSFNMRSQRSSAVAMFFKGQHNVLLYVAMVASLVATSVVVLWAPVAAFFSFDPINAKEYGVAVALAFSIIPIVEIVKLFQRASAKRKAQ